MRVDHRLSEEAPAAVTAETRQASRRLRGGSSKLARAVWVVVAALAATLFVAGIPAEFAVLHDPCFTTQCTTGQLPPEGLRALVDVGLSADAYATLFVSMDVVFASAWCAVAILIFWRRSDDRMGLFVSLALFTFGTSTFVYTLEALAVRYPVWTVPVDLLHFFGSASFGLFLYLFPDGRFVPRWVRWVALILIACQIPRYLFPDWYMNPSTLYIRVYSALWVVALGTIVYSQAYRYRRISSATQRQQTRWVILGIATALVGLLGVSFVLDTFFPPEAVVAYLIGTAISYLTMLLIPLSIGVAMLRYHLFDVNLVVNRTLVYGALSAGVIGLYVLVVGGVGVVLRVQGNLLVSILAAGLIAVLFQPLRERLQRAVNRLMYGERDDPYAVLSRLGQRLETTLAPDEVLPTVTRTMREALKLTYAEIRLKHKEGFKTVAAAGEPAGDTLRLPLVYGGETVGLLVLGLRVGEGSFSPEEVRLFEDLAHQIGVAAHATLLGDEAIRLSVDLQRSRERLVNAREEERRRLRRDLHDGLGPQLASLTMSAEAARDLVSRDPARAEELLAGVMQRAQEAVSDVRRLVYELRPPALDALGLLAALRAYADHHTDGGIRVTVESPSPLPPLPAAVEVAAYRIAMEAVNNVVRHAGARHCEIRLSLNEEAGVLALEVRDDGRGIARDHEPGVGLSSMRERAEELGGSWAIEALPAGGTRVTALLPCALDGVDRTGSRGGT